MGYYEQEKSIGLKPIVIGLSIIAMAGFAAMYYFCGSASLTEGAQGASTPAAQAAAAPKDTGV